MSLGNTRGFHHHYPVLQTILNVSEFGMTMQEAVDAPCFHHQWIPGCRAILNPIRLTLPLKLTGSKSYTIDEKNAPVIGKVDAILRGSDGSFVRVTAGDDTAVGF